MNDDGNGRGKNGGVHRPSSSAPAAGVSLQKVMARYAVPRYGPALSNLLTSVTLYVGLIGAACVALRFSPWLAGGLSVVAAGFLLRTFIVFHDCAHGSFLPSKRANALLGAALGVLVYTRLRCGGASTRFITRPRAISTAGASGTFKP